MRVRARTTHLAKRSNPTEPRASAPVSTARESLEIYNEMLSSFIRMCDASKAVIEHVCDLIVIGLACNLGNAAERDAEGANLFIDVGNVLRKSRTKEPKFRHARIEYGAIGRGELGFSEIKRRDVRKHARQLAL